MTMTDHLSQEDLALFALQLLPEPELRSAQEHLRTCDPCRHAVAEFQGDLGIYALSVEMHTPPAAAREKLLSRIADEGQARSAPGSSSPSQSMQDHVSTVPAPFLVPRPAPRRSFVTWAGWALAAGFALAAGLEHNDRTRLQTDLASERARATGLQQEAAASQAAISTLRDPAAVNVALRQPTAKGAEAPHTPQGYAAYLPDRGALIFVATDLQPLKPYKTYELWLLPAEKNQAPIAAGSFHPDAAGNANMILPAGPKFVAVKGFGVTVEDDKTPPRQPTLPILLMGT